MWEIYPDALDCGILPELFWNSTLNEIMDMMESYVRCKARERKQQINDNFILSKALTLNISTFFSTDKSSELCNPWDFYPQTFKEDKEEYEHQKLEAELAEYRDKRRQWADEFNKRRQQGTV